MTQETQEMIEAQRASPSTKWMRLTPDHHFLVAVFQDIVGNTYGIHENGAVTEIPSLRTLLLSKKRVKQIWDNDHKCPLLSAILEIERPDMEYPCFDHMTLREFAGYALGCSFKGLRVV